MRWLVMAAMVGGTVAMAAPPSWAAGLLEELVWMRDSLVEVSYFCALAAVAPTYRDQHILAMRVVNVLEGSGGPHFDPRLASEDMPGILPRLEGLAQALAQRDLPPEDKEALKFSLENVRVFLSLALEAALRGAGSRRLVRGALSMRQAYAFILAALGPEDPRLAYLGGIRPLLYRYGLPPTP
ncbi:MAG TPA: hypothetical protein ENL11_06740 [Candidatus Acetothermia bacterium]|nr:hypothetical protein [Candidatus Acetothermia bacterium]